MQITAYSVVKFKKVKVKLKDGWVRCSPCTQEVEGSTPTGDTCPNDFPIQQTRISAPTEL